MPLLNARHRPSEVIYHMDFSGIEQRLLQEFNERFKEVAEFVICRRQDGRFCQYSLQRTPKRDSNSTVKKKPRGQETPRKSRFDILTES